MVSGQLPLRKIAPRLRLGFGLGLGLVLGLGGNFPRGIFVLEPKLIFLNEKNNLNETPKGIEHKNKKILNENKTKKNIK